MNDKDIHKYLSNQMTREEEYELLQWIKASPENKKIFYDIKAIWSIRVNSKEPDYVELQQSLDKLNEKIDRITPVKPSSAKKKISLWGSVAASLLIILASYFIVTLGFGSGRNYLTYTNETDTVQIIDLQDGSKVWLSNNSTLSYPAKFGKKYRKVTLHGQAFFEVSADKNRPFSVSADENVIKVLGTSFSVNTSLSDDLIETILVTGAIQLQRTGGTSSTVLHPGQRALYSKETKSVEISEVDASVVTSWRYGLISLSDVSIQTILQCIEDTYNVSIYMDTIPLRNRRYNFSFKRTKSVEEAIGQLTFMTGIPATIK